jgi:hypothetical protein
MKVEPLKIPDAELLKLLSGPPNPRTVGLHLSDIIRDLLKRMDSKRYTDNPAAGLPVWRWETGFIWEEIWSRAFLRSEGVFLQPEILFEGVLMTPDGVHFETEQGWEFKVTWKKACEPSGEESGKFWAWFVQIKAYALALGIEKYRLVVLFVNGDYKGGGPMIGQWEYTFTKKELRENWKMLMDHLKIMRGIESERGGK